jgi:type I restriction enzyme, S subunit
MSAAVRAGYKQTEVGVTPDDWTLINIASVSDMITVGFVGSMAHLFTKVGVPLLRGQDVKPNRLNLSNTELISIDTHKLWKKSALECGDVVIVRVGASAGMACVILQGSAMPMPPVLLLSVHLQTS